MASLGGLIASRPEIMLGRTRVRAMNDRKKISRKTMKETFRLIAPSFPILGIFVGILYLYIKYPPFSSSLFIVFFGFWLGVLDVSLIVIYYLYLAKQPPRSSTAVSKLVAVKDTLLVKTMAYILIAIGIFVGSFILVMYGVTTLGLIKAPAPITSQEVVPTLLLVVSLPILAYVTKREAEKVIQIEMENATDA